MPKSKGKKKRKKSTRGTPLPNTRAKVNGHAPIRSAVNTTLTDDPWFATTLFSSLVVGSVAMGGMNPPDFVLFILCIASLVVARYLSSLLHLDNSTASLSVISKALGKLRTAAQTAQISRGGDLEVNRLEVIAILLILGAMLTVFLFHSGSELSTAFVAVACGLLLALNLLKYSEPFALIVGVLVIGILPCVLAILGAFTQLQTLHAKVATLGLVPGTMLGGALVAKYAHILEQAGWQRSKTKLDRRGNSHIRPAGVAQLYSCLLLGGFFIVFLLAALEILPKPLMIIVLTMLIAPKVADGFLNRSLADNLVYSQTVKLALITSLLSLIGSAL